MFFKIICVAVLFYLVGQLLWSVIYHFFWKRFPGPFAWPFVGNLPQLLLTPNKDLSKFLDFYGRLGPLAEVWLPARMLLVNSAEGGYEVLEQKSSNFVLRPPIDDALRLLGMYHKGLVMNDNIEKWKFSRGLFLRGLHQRFLQQIPAVVARKWDILKQRLPSLTNADGAVDVLDLNRRLITDTIGEITLGCDFGACRGEVPEIVQLVNDWFRLWVICQYEPPFVWKNPLNRNVQKLIASNRRREQILEEMVEQFLAKTAAAGVNQDSDAQRFQPFIQLVCRASQEEDAKLTKAELAQVVFEMIAGGTDTSVNSMAYTCLLLAENSVAQDQLRDEVRRVVRDDPVPDWKQTSQLTYTECVIKESMRIKPVVHSMNHRNREPDTILGHAVPADTLVLVRAFPDPAERHFAQPAHFQPEAHFSAAAVEARAKGAALPFGAGIRQCPGFQFAMVEMKVALALIMRDFQLSIHNGLTLRTLPNRNEIVQVPLQPVWVKLTPCAAH